MENNLISLVLPGYYSICRYNIWQQILILSQSYILMMQERQNIDDKPR